MAAVGGCWGLADCAALEDAAVLGSAAPMAAVGGCYPLVVPAAPAVGPVPASREAISLVRLSISLVHGPAAATPIGKMSRAHAPSRNPLVFMTFSFSRSRIRKPRGIRTAIFAVPTWATNQTFRGRVRDSAGCRPWFGNCVRCETSCRPSAPITQQAQPAALGAEVGLFCA